MSARRLLAMALVASALSVALPLAATAQQPSPPASGSSDHGSQDPSQGHQEHQEQSKPTDPASHPGIPPITDADRAAAFPDVEGHTVHDRAIHSYVLFDQLEWQPGDGGGVHWDTKGWIGRDINRFWFRTEGAGDDGGLEEAEAHFLYGRAIARWWDLVAGIRQEFEPGEARTWAAIGIQGLAPYWFEVEATAHVGASGRTHVRVETEYELLLTNRLVLQPLVEMDLYGKSDPDRGVGAGLSSVDAGLRLRYEVRREVAPYVGIVWSRRFFRTAELAEARGDDTSGVRLALGARVWF